MRRAALLTGLVLTGLVLTVSACGIDTGTVTEKAHDPEYVYFTLQCIPIGNNACASTLQTPQVAPECWRLELHDGEDTGSVCVDQAVWDATAVGQQYRPPD